MSKLSDSLPMLDATSLAATVARGDVSVAEVAEAFIEAVDARNPGINALIRFDADEVRRQVGELEALQRSGRSAPLLGVPFSVKDTIWVQGQKACQGSRLFADFVAPQDALAVQRLRRAGALILGHSNSSEFACKGVTTNKLYGPTRNPWSRNMTPGGSSGGAAAAVSAGLGPFALCTDGGGSTRRPASHTGVVGFKPSAGLIPHPVGFQEPLFGNGVIGLMSRSVADLNLLLPVLAGGDAQDPDAPEGLPAFDAAAALAPVTGLRIALSPRFGLDVPVEPEVAAALQQVAAVLRDAGAIVEERDPVWPPGAGEVAFATLQFAGLAALYGEQWRRNPELFDADIGAQIEQGMALSGAAVAAAYFERAEIYHAMADLFASCDAILTPTTPCTAWPFTELGPKTIDNCAVSPRGHAVFTPMINHSFHAAISVPCGLAANGLPMGAQIIVPRFQDARALALGSVVETAFGHAFAAPKWPFG
ncbi:amidase [Marinobacterium sedimentorum]|uniref:amidase n=1 Tax=Marinobacterium sedimentorum TaxID=2927804 RepID=UPI0020C6B692|nr:amidase [Marinobacterium sedimentorum]MCP8688076.1 amidase [Marinobacterium sedimentorum]